MVRARDCTAYAQNTAPFNRSGPKSADACLGHAVVVHLLKACSPLLAVVTCSVQVRGVQGLLFLAHEISRAKSPCLEAAELLPPMALHRKLPVVLQLRDCGPVVARLPLQHGRERDFAAGAPGQRRGVVAAPGRRGREVQRRAAVHGRGHELGPGEVRSHGRCVFPVAAPVRECGHALAPGGSQVCGVEPELRIGKGCRRCRLRLRLRLWRRRWRRRGGGRGGRPRARLWRRRQSQQDCLDRPHLRSALLRMPDDQLAQPPAHGRVFAMAGTRVRTTDAQNATGIDPTRPSDTGANIFATSLIDPLEACLSH
mmetsp:Transcript_71538/g.197526  ORF Transcript_71538/g.197526 Transcript_71538/m.197526 type:complete len:312 (-) Transcript_71538:187-1122(-)